MKSRFLLTLLVYTMILCSKAYSSVVINGRIDSAGFKKIYLTNRGNSLNNLFIRKIYDSCISNKDGSFYFSIKHIVEGQYYSIELSIDTIGWIPLLPRDGEALNIKATLSTYIINRSISGCKECLLQDSLNSTEYPVIIQLNSYADTASYYRGRNEDDSAQHYSHLNRMMVDSITTIELMFIKEHPNSLYSLQLLRSNRIRIKKDTLRNRLFELNTSLQNTVLYSFLLAYANTPIIQAGDAPVAVAIIDSSRHDSTVDFTKCKGKTILLDFWASWCVPCRKNIPAMKAVFTQLDTAKYSFISISIDSEQGDWIEALDKEKMTWSNYRSATESREKTMTVYSLTSIPKYILIKPDGKIALISDSFKPIAIELKKY